MTTTRSYKFVVYKAMDGHRWHLQAPNGKLIADSGEAYCDAKSAKRSVSRLRQILAYNEIALLIKEK